MKNPTVIVANPGSHHLYQTAIGLQKDNLLGYYVTGIYFKPDKFPYFLIDFLPGKLKDKIKSEFERRRYRDLSDSKVKTFGFYEWLYIINSRTIRSEKINRFIIDRRNENFSVKAGRLAKNKSKAIWAAMDGALESFEIAKPAGVKCILDQFIGHPASLNKILEEEIKIDPGLERVCKDMMPEKK